MEIINNVNYYTLNEILLKLYLATLKKHYGTNATSEWQQIIKINGKSSSLPIIEETIVSMSFILNSCDEDSFCKTEYSKIFPVSSVSERKGLERGYPVSPKELLIDLLPNKNLSEDEIKKFLDIRKSFLNQFEELEDYLYEADLTSTLESLDAQEISKYKNFNALDDLWDSLCISFCFIEYFLLKDFKHKLSIGEIRANGYEFPLKSTSARKEISPDHWNLLELSPSGSAEKDGYKYVNLLFRKAEPIIESTSNTAPVKRGRISKIDLIAEEMKRRASAGELDLRGLKAECNHLREWCQKQHKQVYNAGSLEKKLGKLYRELSAAHTKL